MAHIPENWQTNEPITPNVLNGYDKAQAQASTAVQSGDLTKIPTLVQAAYGSGENEYTIAIPNFTAQHGTQVYIFVSPDTPTVSEDAGVQISINGGEYIPILLGPSYRQFHELGEPVIALNGRAFSWGIIHVVFYELDAGGELLPVAVNITGAAILANNALSRGEGGQYMQGGTIDNSDASVPNSTGYVFRGIQVMNAAGTSAVATKNIFATRK